MWEWLLELLKDWLIRQAMDREAREAEDEEEDEDDEDDEEDSEFTV